jgi:hypothetical protein
MSGAPVELGAGLPGGAAGLARGPEAGMRLTATVLANHRQGPVLALAGTVWLARGERPLPAGAAVLLELAGRPAAGPLSARLIAVDGQRLAPPATWQLEPRPALQPAGRSDASLVVSARMVGATGMPSGPPLALRLAAPPGAPPATAGAGAPASNPAASVASTADLAAGSAAPARSSAAAPTADPTIAPTGRSPLPGADGGALVQTGAPPAASLPARMVGMDPQGHPLLQAGGVLLRLDQPLRLPHGAALRLDLAAPLPTEPPSSDARSAPVAAGTPLAAAPALDFDGRLGAGLLALIQALLPSGRGPGATRPAAPEARRGSEPESAAEPQRDSGRAASLLIGAAPVEVLQITLGGDAADQAGRDVPAAAAEEPAQRVVFGLELSRLGRCELDTLCRGRRFDLAIRTAQPLDGALQAALMELFTAACAAGDLRGQLVFQRWGGAPTRPPGWQPWRIIA